MTRLEDGGKWSSTSALHSRPARAPSSLSPLPPHIAPSQNVRTLNSWAAAVTPRGPCTSELHGASAHPFLPVPPTCAFDVIVRDALPVLHKRLQKVDGGLPLRREQTHNLCDHRLGRHPHSQERTFHYLLGAGSVLGLGEALRSWVLKRKSNTFPPGHIRTVANDAVASLPDPAPCWNHGAPATGQDSIVLGPEELRKLVDTSEKQMISAQQGYPTTEVHRGEQESTPKTTRAK